MRKNIFRKSYILPVLAVVLVLGAGMGSAYGYFTTYTEAAGGFAIKLGDSTDINETFSAWTKHVSITSREDSQPVYIRVKGFCGSEYELEYIDESGKWSLEEDGYYHYRDIVYGGESTDELLVRIGGIPEEVAEPTEFNVVVIYESTPVRYDEAGNPYADWTVTLDSGSDSGVGGEG